MSRRQPVFHPILFGLYPVLFLFGMNGEFFGVELALRPAVVITGVVGVLWFVATKVMGDRESGAVPVSVATLLFFSFQPIRDSLASGPDGMGAGAWVISGSLLAALAAFGAFLKFRSALPRISYAMNVVSLVLVCVPFTRAVGSRLLAPETPLPDRSAFEAGVDDPIEVENAPDVYYLLLDGYGRADYLASEFGFDNSDFIGNLERKGFYVAGQSVANYPQTIQAIASALNFEYLEEVLGRDLGESRDRRIARELLRGSRARRIFEAAGYKTVSFSTIFYDAETSDTDVYVSRFRDMTLFEMGLLRMTPLPWALGPVLYDLHRDRTRHAFEALAEAPDIPGPKFVYFHAFVGHPPFLYGEGGAEWSPDRPYSWDEGKAYLAHPGATREEYIAGYQNQVRALNPAILRALDSIIEKSQRPPVIIVHGDHGPGSGLSQHSLAETDVAERYSIFNAYHLPGAAAEDLYESISPVNSFRIVMNRYFGKDYPLLEDRSVFTPFDRPYAFEDVPTPSAAAARDPLFAGDAR